jgi:hypothetical protein
MKNKKNTKSVGSGKHLAFPLLFLLATGLSGTVHADMTLTAAGVNAGFTLTTFATNFPSTGAGGTGPVGIAFPGSGVMVSDWPGHVRVLPSHADGQDAGAVSATAYGTAAAVGLAQIGGNFYMAQNAGSRVVQVNPDGTLNQAIVDVFCATGLVADPFTGHLFVSGGCTGAGITEVDPVAKTATAFNSLLSDGLALSNDGHTLYAADITGHHVLGFDTTSKAQVFDSGAISFVDGIAVGSGVLAGKIFANTNFGELWEVDLASSAQTLIASGGSRGDFVTADPSDGTLLVTQSDRILRLHPPAGGSFGNGPANLLNISTRMRVLTGDNVLIGGFIVTGTDAKKVIARGIGPSLTSQGVPGALADPTLELHDGTGATIASNDNWKDTQQAEIQATGIPPSNDLESAIVATLPANNSAYTAILRGKNNTTGVGLVEVYDLDQSANSTLANISTRGFVDTDDNVMIGGFILGPSGTSGAKVIARAIGPSLTASGVANALQDPTLELHDGSGTTIAFDDNWKDSQQAEIQATGIPPSDDRESAIVATLAPGNYTAIVRGKNNTNGVGLVEVYNLR